jgi:hypothetical protein
MLSNVRACCAEIWAHSRAELHIRGTGHEGGGVVPVECVVYASRFGGGVVPWAGYCVGYIGVVGEYEGCGCLGAECEWRVG